MMKRNRMLAILLAFTMVLTFMPMLAFAEGEEAGEDQQVTEAEAEAVEEVPAATEEAVSEEAVDTTEEEAVEAASVNPVKGEVQFNNKIWGYAGSRHLMDNDFRQAGNSVKVSFSDGTVVNYVFVSDDSKDLWDFYPDGDGSKKAEDFEYKVSEGGLQPGTNKVTLQMWGDDGLIDIGTFDAEGVNDEAVVSVEYKQANPITATMYESGYVEYFGVEDDNYYEPFAGDTITVKCYDGDEVVSKEGPYTAVYECKKYTNSEIGVTSYEFILTKMDPAVDEWFNDPVLQGRFQELEFWEDEDQEKTPWKTGSTHELAVSLNGVKASGKCIVNVTGNAAPHAHAAGAVEKVVVTEATCTKAGSYDEVTYCKECGQEMSRVRKTSPALGHSIHKMAAKAATCQETGVKAHYECSNCGGMFKDAKGKKTTTVKALTIKKKKHNFKKKSGEYLKSAATCTKPAVYYYTCTMCGSKGTKTYKSGKALGHKFEQAVTKATPTKNGSIGQKCTVCGKKGKNKAIPKASKIAVVKKYKKKGVPAAALAGGAFIEVKNAKGKKIAASEYDITFSNNEEAGTGTATITFKGANYEGSKVVSYKIVK